MMGQYRNNGAIGAILDEYERSIKDLSYVIHNVSPSDLIQIVDPHTEDNDCRSIQTILTHVLRSGYGYATYIHNHIGDYVEFFAPNHLDSAEKYIAALKEMFLFTEIIFLKYPDITLEENDTTKKINSRWGQQYDVEQLMEHTIVHILRHRRQIERFLIKIKGS